MPDQVNRYILLISVHGLIRGEEMELGRDADTGGQVTYVVELARALVEHPAVERVDLVTRQVSDPRVDESYSVPIEELASGVNIVRVRCGPNRYLSKEALWPHLDMFVDNTLKYLRSIGRPPDLIHGHYADAGYVASRLSGILNVPLAFTGHSLGRVKRQRLLDQGSRPETIERRYRISRRIEAEETALDHAALVVASTNQEVEEQYAIYDHYQPRRKVVIPPGVDLSRFSPPKRFRAPESQIFERIRPFLRDWRKPVILALSRPDPRKNISTLLKAYSENRELRDKANLVIVAGSRTDIREMPKGPRDVLTELLYLIDFYDLYGSVAYPKAHDPEDIPDLYRLAARNKGVFINPALTEPFGLTLLEAAASGLPIVATADGGPADIVGYCRNGLLIDPLNPEAMGKALLDALSNREQWRKWSHSGVSGVKRHFSWASHVNKYIRATRMIIHQSEKRRFYAPRNRLITADRLLVSDIDNTLVGDERSLQKLLGMLRQVGEKVAFGIATGRNSTLTLEVLKSWKVPTPQLLITSVGTFIRYGPHLVRDRGWEKHINFRWRPEAVKEVMAEFRGLELQPPEGQGPFKVSYDADPEVMPSIEEIQRTLRKSRLQVNLVFSHQAYLDVLPIRASKGMALRYFATKWGIPLERCLVAGDSGNDEEMLTGNTLGVVVGNHDPELEKLRGDPWIYFAEGHYAQAIIEAIEHYDFFGQIRQPVVEAAYD
jgi:sucrose-phosphate synthase